MSETASSKPEQNESERPRCGKNHIKIVVGLCAIPLIPFLFALTVGQYWQESSNLNLRLVFYVIYLCVVGVAFREAVDLIRKKGWSSCCKWGRIAVAAGLYLAPWGLHFALYPLGPGFIMPLLHNFDCGAYSHFCNTLASIWLYTFDPRQITEAVISDDIVFYPTGFFRDCALSYSRSSCHNNFQCALALRSKCQRCFTANAACGSSALHANAKSVHALFTTYQRRHWHHVCRN